MRKYLILLLVFFALQAVAQKNVYAFKVADNQGKMVSLKKWKGDVLLIVNTATKCGFTPQYKALEALYEKYKAEGFSILDFPCNQFGQQAPGSAAEIHEFCTSNFDVHFPQFAKIDVNGSHEIALFSYLKREQGFRGFGIGTMAEAMDKMLKKQDALYASNSDIKWNFTKFLVSREGKVIARFEPTDDMDMVEKCIVEALHK